MDWTSIIVTLIGAVVTIITVVYKAQNTDKKVDNMHAMSEQSRIRSEIMQLIMEDKLSVMEGELPSNYKDIMALYDYYDSQHWNTYIHRKVDAYEAWYNNLTEKGEKKCPTKRKIS